MNKNLENQLIDCNFTTPCLVCSHSTSILHFQLNVCRACAVFFRRSLNNQQNYVCQTNTKDCNITIKHRGKTLCKYCRYQKCFEVGMRHNNNSSKKETKENETKTDNMENLVFGNFDNVFEYVLKIFKEAPSTSIAFSENYTEQFNNLLLKILETTKPSEKLVMMKDAKIRINFVRDFYIGSAQMLCKYQPFATLPFKDKVLIHSEFWLIFSILERAYQTRQYYGNDINDTRFLIDKYQFIDISRLKESEFFAKKIEQENCTSFLIPSFLKAEINMKRFRKSNPSYNEFAYMCQIILWSTFEIADLEESTHKMAENVQEKISENLHNYYIEELRMPYYAARQAKLFRMIHSIKCYTQDSKQSVTAAKMFNDFEKTKIPCCPFIFNFVNYFDKLSL